MMGLLQKGKTVESPHKAGGSRSFKFPLQQPLVVKQTPVFPEVLDGFARISQLAAIIKFTWNKEHYK